MSFMTIIVTLVVVGSGLWALNTYLPLAPSLKSAISAVVVVLLSLWLLHTFGVIDSLKGLRSR